MITWTLILVLAGADARWPPAVTAVPGLTTQAACEAAGRHMIDQAHQLQLGSAFQCVEVRG